MKLKIGLIQVYTGSGKGKTTAALGQGLRAAGRGLRVYMVQFLKNRTCGELEAVKTLHPNFQILRFESPKGFFWTLNDDEKSTLKCEIEQALNYVRQVLDRAECDILILDEIMAVIKNGLVTESCILELLNNKPENIEIILTGRDAPATIIEAAHLVTSMECVKHPYNLGIPAREGIED
jgi:cob(I)alamin adenosyltransferase